MSLRYRNPGAIVFPFVSTHPSFVYDNSNAVYNKTSPIIKLKQQSCSAGLTALLNSSTALFWMKQVFFNKGAGGGTRVQSGRSPLGDEAWENHYEHDGTKLARFPVEVPIPSERGNALQVCSQELKSNLPKYVVAQAIPSRRSLTVARGLFQKAARNMTALQEELDWQCYRLYQITEATPEHPSPPELQLGERAFEIIMARRMQAGSLKTTWFERHGSTPVTELPVHWPADYRAVVERRIALIESDPSIALIESPEYKRRWSMPPWEELEKQALRGWLLDRLEDQRFWPADDPRLVSTRQLADAARRYTDFLSVAELYAGHPGFDLEALVAELVAKEVVPFLAAFRYAETGLCKRAQWEETWEKQRREDAIDAEVAERRDEFLWDGAARFRPRQDGETAEAWSDRLVTVTPAPEIQARADRLIEEEQKRRKKEEVGDIPVPPKYRTADFQTQDYWRLRGSLDVPKERFVSFPQCHRDTDGSPVVTWAGYDHLACAKAIAAYYIERKETDGWAAERLKPLLAGLAELLPWLCQWHNAYDRETGLRMGDYFAEFVRDESRSLGMTEADLAAWAPPAAPRRARSRRATPSVLSLEDLL